MFTIRLFLWKESGVSFTQLVGFIFVHFALTFLFVLCWLYSGLVFWSVASYLENSWFPIWAHFFVACPACAFLSSADTLAFRDGLIKVTADLNCLWVWLWQWVVAHCSMRLTGDQSKVYLMTAGIGPSILQDKWFNYGWMYNSHLPDIM